MANIAFTGLTEGSASPRIEKFPVKATTDIEKGTIVVINNANGISFTAGTDAKYIAGTVANDYKATKDEFNPGNGSGYIEVNVSGSSVYKKPLDIIDSVEDCPDSMVYADTSVWGASADGLHGGYLVLLEKGSNSITKAEVGDKIEIDYTSSTDGVYAFIIKSGNYLAGKGDKYLYVPAVGLDCFGVDDGELVYDKSKHFARVIGVDEKTRCAYLVLTNTLTN